MIKLNCKQCDKGPVLILPKIGVAKVLLKECYVLMKLQKFSEHKAK